MSKWYIVDLIVREKILVEISDDEDEYDAKEIALGESRLFRGQEICRTEFTVTRDPADTQMRLGFAQNDPSISFKTISNRWLLKNKE